MGEGLLNGTSGGALEPVSGSEFTSHLGDLGQVTWLPWPSSQQILALSPDSLAQNPVTGGFVTLGRASLLCQSLLLCPKKGPGLELGSQKKWELSESVYLSRVTQEELGISRRVRG